MDSNFFIENVILALFLHENDQIITYSSSIAHGRLKKLGLWSFLPILTQFQLIPMTKYASFLVFRVVNIGFGLLYARGGYTALQNIQTGSIHHGIHSKGLIAIYHDRLYSQNQQKIMRHLIFHVFGSRLAKSSKSLYVQF